MKKEQKLQSATPVVKKKKAVRKKKRAVSKLGHTGFGRPPKYQDKYCREIVDLMAAGYTHLDFCGRISITEATLYNWAKRYPDFLEAIKIGKMKSIAFWSAVARAASTGIDAKAGDENITNVKNISPVNLIFQLKNRGWKDVVDLNIHDDKVSKVLEAEEIEGEEVEETQADRVKKLFKKYGTELAISASIEDGRNKK